MIENYEEKRENKRVEMQFAESGNVLLFEHKFNEATGLPYMKPIGETSTSHIDDLIADKRAMIAPTLAEIADLEAMRPDIEAKEAERAEIEANAVKNSKEKNKK